MVIPSKSKFSGFQGRQNVIFFNTMKNRSQYQSNSQSNPSVTGGNW
jgi:hypothetical protein